MVGHSYLMSRVEKYGAYLQDGAVTFIKALANRSRYYGEHSLVFTLTRYGLEKIS